MSPVDRIITNAEGEQEAIRYCGTVDARDADPADWRMPRERLERIARNVENLRRRHDSLVEENKRLRGELRRERLTHLETAKRGRAASVELLARHRDDIADRIIAELPAGWDVADVIGPDQ